MRNFLLLFSGLIFFNFIFAQSRLPTEKQIATNSFFAEGGGPGIAFSANFDKRFKNSHLGLGGRIGVGFVSADESTFDPAKGYYHYEETSALTFPVQLNYIFGKAGSPHSFEVGAGVTYITKELEIMNF